MFSRVRFLVVDRDAPSLLPRFDGRPNEDDRPERAHEQQGENLGSPAEEIGDDEQSEDVAQELLVSQPSEIQSRAQTLLDRFRRAVRLHDFLIDDGRS